MKRLVMTGLVLAAAVSLAMPTKQDFKVAEPIVAELMASAVADYRSKKKTAAEVGEISVQFAQKAETEAAKFLLYRGAVNFLTRGEEYDKAVDAALALQAAIPDLPAEDLAEVVSRATVRATDRKAPRLFALYRKLKTQAASSVDAKNYEKMLKKSPDDLSTRRKYAEALAAAGSWKAALAEFAKLKDNAAKFAQAELDGMVKAYEAGEYWWAYEPTYDKADETFKAHAAAFYRQALASGAVTGLRVELIKHRIEPYADEPDTVQLGQIGLKADGGMPFVVSGNHATLSLKTGAKLEFVKCPPGEVEMTWASLQKNGLFGKSVRKKAFISRPFWIMTVPVRSTDFDATVKGLGQYKDSVGRTAYDKIVQDAVPRLNEELSTFLPQGYVIRLPSLAEWNYAFRANSTDDHDIYAVFADKRDLYLDEKRELADFEMLHQSLWETKKNAWGIHDYSYLLESVLDCVDESMLSGYDKKTMRASLKPEMVDSKDPFFWSEGLPGGSLKLTRYVTCVAVFAKPFRQGAVRLVIGPDLVSEWRARHAKK